MGVRSGGRSWRPPRPCAGALWGCRGGGRASVAASLDRGGGLLWHQALLGSARRRAGATSPGSGLPPRWFSGTCVSVHVHCVCACASVCLCVHACVCTHPPEAGREQIGARRGPEGLGGGAQCLLHCSCDLLRFGRSGRDENVCCALSPWDRGLEAVTHGPVTAQQVPLCLPGASGGSQWVWL